MADMPGEFDLITRLFEPLTAGEPGAFNLSDDAAVITPPPGKDIVVTSDTIVAGVHFLRTDPPQSVAVKLLAVNLSDLAAMGATPHAYTLAAAWPRDISADWLAAFAAGLGAAQSAAYVNLVGGDTVATPGPMTLNITAFGLVPPGMAVLRSGAAPGDHLFVSGTIGDAALGLKVLDEDMPAPISDEDRAVLTGRYREPTARLNLGQAISGVASAAIDISDGLIADLRHLADASNVHVTINADNIPLSDASRRAVELTPDLYGLIYNGGDDYELAFTIPAGHVAEFRTIAATIGTNVSEIGRVFESRGKGDNVSLVDGDGADMKVPKEGYQHF